MDRGGGMVVGMGRGSDGQLAIPSKNEVNLPRPINALRNIRVSIIACGMAHSGIVTDTGTLLMFGKGKYGRLGTGEEDDQVSPIEVRIGLKSRVTALSCGGFHTGVVTARGELYTFGRGESGQLGLGIPDKEQCTNWMIPMRVTFIQQKVTKVACGHHGLTHLSAQGEMYGFGSNEKGQLGVGQALQGTYSVPQRIPYQTYTKTISAYPSAIACGHQFSAMILEGAVLMWGQNEKGQCGVGGSTACIWEPSLTAFQENVFVTSISCGLDHTLAVTELGQVYTWGSCEYGQLGIASELLSISSRSSSPRNAAAAINYLATPFLVKEALLHERIVTGCCGSYHSVVVTIDGKLFSWGLGDKGQLGKAVEGSGVAPYPYHVRLKNIGENEETTRIAVLAAGGRHTLAATYSKPLISVPPATLAADLERLYSSLSSPSPSFFDVEIYVQNDSTTFDAHRIFLSRVPKLHAMLVNSGNQALQELRFPSVSRGCMAIVLHYIYTNKVPMVKDEEVKQLAQEWGLNHLYARLTESSTTEEVLPPSISRHLKKYVNNPEFSDVAFSFVTEDGASVKIYAHKAILVLRCEFFLLEFAGNFKESIQPVIALSDITPTTFLQLMHFIYQDEVSIQSESVDLMALSNLYQLLRLKNLCEQTIVDQIDVDNAVVLYEIAQQYEAPQLLAYCDYFIITQYDRVSQTNDFKMKFLASKQLNFSEKFDNWNKQQNEGPPVPVSQSKCSLQ